MLKLDWGSLVVQRLRICLPTQGTRVRSVVWEESTCHLSMGFSRQENWEWVAMSFSRGSSWPRDWSQVSCTAGRFFTNWAMREAQEKSLQWEAHTPQLETGPCSLQLEKAGTRQQRPRTAPSKYNWKETRWDTFSWLRKWWRVYSESTLSPGIYWGTTKCPVALLFAEAPDISELIKLTWSLPSQNLLCQPSVYGGTPWI